MKRQPSVQDISWFIDLDNRDQLDLNPPYQRRSVWTASDRKFFLDTLFRNYPCPPIFIHKTIDDNGLVTYHIVDGKQRIETILLFANNKIALDKNFGNEKLDGLRFKKLDQDMKKTFWNYNVPVDFIDISNDLDINEVFDRVNRNSRNLERQELRHARYDGWFIQECETEADDDPFWETLTITTKAKAKRMKNVQFVSELLLVLIEKRIIGFDQNYLDESYALYDSIDNEEDGISFDLDGYKASKIRLKTIVERMESYNKCFSEKAKTNYNLYTLFAFIILNNLNDELIIPIAKKYNDFMELVNLFRQADDPDEVFTNQDSSHPNWDNAYKYYKATRGANTDLPQRKHRLDSIKEVLFRHENS